MFSLQQYKEGWESLEKLVTMATEGEMPYTRNVICLGFQMFFFHKIVKNVFLSDFNLVVWLVGSFKGGSSVHTLVSHSSGCSEGRRVATSGLKEEGLEKI